MKKNIITGLMLCLAILARAADVQYLTITCRGRTVSFALAEQPRLTYADDLLRISTPTGDTEIAVDGISGITFTDTPTGIVGVPSPKVVAPGHAIFNKLPPRSLVQVFDMNGMERMSTQTPNSGWVSLNLNILPTGTYVIRTENQTFKFNKK